MKRPQRAIDVSEHAAGPSILVGASGQRQQRSLVCERTAFKRATAAIGSSNRKRSINPAFQDRGYAEPPQRKLLDHQIAPLNLAYLGIERGGEPIVSRRVGFFALLAEIIGIANGGEVATVRNRIKVHGIEI